MFLLLCCLLLLLASGCQSNTPVTFSSVLAIQADESGTRTITGFASKHTIDSIFSNSNTMFQTFISANIPQTLEWEYQETSTGYDLTFTIAFDSLEEYQEIIASLTGNSSSITLSRPQVGVTTGFTLTESCTVTDLFQWLLDAIRERTGKSEAELRSLFLSGDNTLSYAGHDYEQTGSGLTCYVETLHDAESIDILTTISSEASWSRTVYVTFPEEMLDNAANVKPYLSSMLPEGITESWSSSRIWCLEFPEETPTQLTSRMAELFRDTDDSFSETILADSPIQIAHEYLEPLDLSFLVPNSGSTSIRCYLSNQTASSIYLMNGEGERSLPDDLTSDYESYTCLYSIEGHALTLSFASVYEYQPVEIAIHEAPGRDQQMVRTLTLDFGEIPSETHRSVILSAMTEAAADLSTLEESLTDERYQLRIRQSGSFEELQEAFQALFQGSNSISLTWNSLEPFAFCRTGLLEETLDFSAFLPQTGKTLISLQIGACAPLLLRQTAADASAQSEIELNTATSLFSLSLEVSYPNPLLFWLYACGTILGLFLLTRLLRYYLRNSAAKKRSRRSSTRQTAGQKLQTTGQTRTRTQGKTAGQTQTRRQAAGHTRTRTQGKTAGHTPTRTQKQTAGQTRTRTQRQPTGQTRTRTQKQTALHTRART